MLSALFQDSDFILFMLSDRDKVPHSPIFVSAPRASSDLGNYYSINPIDPYNNRNLNGARSPRASINVRAYRNFLFEIDSMPLKTQEELMRFIHPRIPLAQVVFSGSSSLHAIISVSDTLPFEPHTEKGILQYSQAWRALNAELTSISSEFLGRDCPAQLFDSACKDPARLSRTPGSTRPDTLKVQAELNGFGGYINSDFLLNTIRKHGFSESSLAPALPLDESMDCELLEAALLLPENKGLRSKLLNVELWAAPENMYPALFQLTLWIIDATGAPLETTTAFMRSYVFPIIRAANYPRNPEIPVYNAYSWKGLT